MKLSLDTTHSEHTRVALIHEGQTYEKTAPHSVLRAQNILPLLEVLLREHDVHLSDISEITVAPGPGSYTGLRVGFAVGNMLALLLQIPLNGKIPPSFPLYSS